MQNNQRKLRSMTKCQSFIAATSFVVFFVLYFLWTAIGENVLCWLESHPGTASWVQAIFGFGSIFVAITVPYFIRISEEKQKNKVNIKNAKNKFIIISNDFVLIMHRLCGYASIIEERSDLNESAYDWSRRYIRVFDKFKLPKLEELECLDVLPENYSIRLSLIYNVIKSFEENFYFTYQTALETEDFKERNLLLKGTLELINGNLKIWRDDLDDLVLGFKQSNYGDYFYERL